MGTTINPHGSVGIFESRYYKKLRQSARFLLAVKTSSTTVERLYLRLKEQVGDENADIRVDKFDLDTSDDDYSFFPVVFTVVVLRSAI